MRGRKGTREWICPICQHVFETRRLMYNHRKEEHPGGNPDFRIRRDYVCKYCNKIVYTTKQGIYTHESRCINNPTRVIADRSFTHTEQFRKKCSDNMKRRILSGESLHTWNPPQQSRSYAEQYFYDILVEKCHRKSLWVNNYRVGKYMLDFANIQAHTYFEVDGEQHYTEEGKMHDVQRTMWLEQNGWQLITRVRWKCFYALTREEKDKYIEELIEKFTYTNENSTQPIDIIPLLIPNTAVKRRRYKYTKTEWLNICKLRKEQRLATNLNIKTARYKQALENGLIRSDGKINGKGVPSRIWEIRKTLILQSSVDLSKFGWVNKVVKETGLSKRIIENTVKRFADVFSDKCFYRAGAMIINNHMASYDNNTIE